MEFDTCWGASYRLFSGALLFPNAFSPLNSWPRSAASKALHPLHGHARALWSACLLRFEWTSRASAAGIQSIPQSMPAAFWAFEPYILCESYVSHIYDIRLEPPSHLYGGVATLDAPMDRLLPRTFIGCFIGWLRCKSEVSTMHTRARLTVCRLVNPCIYRCLPIFVCTSYVLACMCVCRTGTSLRAPLRNACNQNACADSAGCVPQCVCVFTLRVDQHACVTHTGPQSQLACGSASP